MWNVSRNEGILEFTCNQLDANIIMFSIYYNVRSTDKDTMILIDATDTYCYA